ncbi:MAG: hypothetical protein LBB83_01850 [Treponema sp.]|nr:hypothetical protein [Treponema sp.]
MDAKKETFHKNLKLLSPAHLHYVWGLVDGLCHRESAGKTAEPEKPVQSIQACPPVKGEGQDSPLQKG